MTEKTKPELIEDKDLETAQGGHLYGAVSKNPLVDVKDASARPRGLLDTMDEGETDGV